jgi:hypothetical protein
MRWRKTIRSNYIKILDFFDVVNEIKLLRKAGVETVELSRRFCIFWALNYPLLRLRPIFKLPSD